MLERDPAETEAITAQTTTQSTQSTQNTQPSESSSYLSRRLSSRWQILKNWLIQDWRTNHVSSLAALLLLCTLIPVIGYYLNFPESELNADTPAYLHVVDRLQQHFLLVDTWRLPGYPLLITFVYALAGQGNLLAVSIVQAILFTLATLEIYTIAILLFKRAWLAFLIGLLVGTNIVLLSYVKPIMSEGLALWLLTTMVLAMVYFLRTMHKSAFWLVILCLISLIFTRPEWLYLPVPLLAYFLLVARHRGQARSLLRHLFFALALIYLLAGSYIGINTLTNHYAGMTAIENFNWMGKVLQYDMWNETPPEDAQLSKQIDYYVAQIDKDPYHILPHISTLASNNDTPAGRFARSIILHHPLEFLLKSVPMTFASLTSYFDIAHGNTPGPFAAPLAWLKSIHRILYSWNILFPACAALWLLLLCWKRTRSQPAVLEMGAIVLVALYALIITTLGGYRLDDYMRVHIVFDPLLILVIWGSLLLGSILIVQRIRRRRIDTKR